MFSNEQNEVKSIEEYDEEIENIISDCIDNTLSNSIDTSNLKFFSSDAKIMHINKEIETEQRRINYMKRLIFISNDIDKRKAKIDDEVEQDIIRKIKFAYSLIKK
ncbi:TPA: hypothetical protein PBB88_002711 [Staphylococcus aureus]|uniref:hypothetical protein n=1 Tax=Staphylococcus argenteus TaxID=985002 RepID=UPI00091D5773|nr:hypothetical protein [Staphylococcus argenteus]SHD20901.1 Uncharacterised protein [Staphylococcus argenteus]HAR5752979.1 hypothetical protein [Staphylococcus pseudintermedius]HDD5929515.1 hypothetical protein [Staphylococcus aureus]HEH3017354.1 hypothetical protein [Staphylococcus aureus]